jgi:hypothetical protein
MGSVVSLASDLRRCRIDTLNIGVAAQISEVYSKLAREPLTRGDQGVTRVDETETAVRQFTAVK